MAGLIQQQMGGAPEGSPQEEAQESPQQEQQEEASGVDQDADDKQGGDSDDPQSNPAFQQAMMLVHQVLYRNGAAVDVAKALRSGGNPAEALANTAYDMTSTIDEKTQGQVPDDLLAALATYVLSEVADIAEAAGIKVDGAMIAQAVQMMLLRFVHEAGGDSSQLQQAMGSMDPQQVGAMLDKHAGGAPQPGGAQQAPQGQ